MSIVLDVLPKQQAKLATFAYVEGCNVTDYVKKVVLRELEQERHEGKKLVDFRVGDSISGHKITAIDFAHPQFLIFRNEIGNIGYVIRVPQVADKAQTEFQKIRSEVQLQPKGVFREETNTLLSSCLGRALLDEDVKSDPTKMKEHFQAVKSFIKDRGPVNYIYGQGVDWIVYLNRDSNVSYEYPTLPGTLVDSMTKFNRIQHILFSAKVTKKKSHAAEILGSELSWLFRSGRDSAATSFVSSTEFITEQIEAPLRSWYVLWSVGWSFALLLLLGIVGYRVASLGLTPWTIISGCMGGIVGAAISIIQRGEKLIVNPFVGRINLALQGLVRVFLGMIFGGVLVVAAKANITMGILADNAWSLFIFSIVAGFSERFVPDVLGRIASERPSSS